MLDRTFRLGGGSWAALHLVQCHSPTLVRARGPLRPLFKFCETAKQAPKREFDRGHSYWLNLVNGNSHKCHRASFRDLYDHRKATTQSAASPLTIPVEDAN